MNRVLFNDSWFFCKQPIQSSFSVREACKYDQWEEVEIPHDWLVSSVKEINESAEGWYKKSFLYEATRGSRVVFHADGIYQDCTLFLNGVQIATWKNGYTPFSVDLSKDILQGENELFIRVKDEKPNSRWYAGAGIYRNLWIEYTKEDYILSNGIMIDTVALNEQDWEVEIETELHLQHPVILVHRLYDRENLVEECRSELTMGDYIHRNRLVVTSPALWHPDTPHVYTLKTCIYRGGEVQYEVDNPVGFRTITYTANKGMFINGQAFHIKGVCLHHDLGCLGSAVNTAAIRRQLMLMKEMGANAIRTAHNPFSKEFYELTDELGFFVQTEFTDVWKHGKTTYDYSRYFSEWYERDVKAWVKSQRNNPSVCMWSIGNEIYDTHGREDGLETTRVLKELVSTLDPKKHAIVTFGSNYMQWEGSQQAAEYLEAVGYNYGEKLYGEHHEKHPTWKIYGSETGSVVQSRGVYHFPLEQSMLADDDKQCSSLGNSSTSWGATSIESCIVEDLQNPFSLGQFLWTGIDYIGEPTPYSTKNSYLGQVDTAGFPKDAYYVVQAGWISPAIKPMIHIFPYWDFQEGEEIDVCVTSNAHSVELMLNGRSLGKKMLRTNESISSLVASWKVPYEKGELLAIGYDGEGAVLCEERARSFNESATIVLRANKDWCYADGEDLLFVEISTVDEHGTWVSNARDTVEVCVTGAGRLVGLDNGDSTDYSEYMGDRKRLFNGKLLAVIAPTYTQGDIHITASIDGVDSQTYTVSSRSCEPKEGRSLYLKEVQKTKIQERIAPAVRKIELTTIENTLTRIVVEASILPASAGEQPLHWRVTDVQGIDSPIVRYEVEEKRITIYPEANGTFYVRAGVNNGKECMDFYSFRRYTVSHLEDAKLNPYTCISGGLYTSSNVALTNGNERGVATLRGVESWVTFSDVDFGKLGSSYMRIALFPLETDPFSFEVWRGVPSDATSVKVADCYYDKGSIWNTYQEVAYEFYEVLTGIQTITFVFQRKVHIRDFVFVEREKAYLLHDATACDFVYGDSYTTKGNKIEGIGNNVTLQFKQMNFSNGTTRIRMTGCSPRGTTSIRLQFQSETEKSIRMIEFPYSTTYTRHEFDMEELVGEGTVEFVFLPGSYFNFESFEFIKDEQHVE